LTLLAALESVSPSYRCLLPRDEQTRAFCADVSFTFNPELCANGPQCTALDDGTADLRVKSVVMDFHELY
jgi:hypothetical protein